MGKIRRCIVAVGNSAARAKAHVSWTARTTAKILTWEIPPSRYERWGLYTQAVVFVAFWTLMELRPFYTGRPIATGYAIAALALAGVVMAARGDALTSTEKIVWIIICAVLFVWELRVIDQEHAALERQHLQDLKDQKDEFEKTISQLNGISGLTLQNLKETESAANSAKESVESLMGTNSFLYFYPHGQLMMPSGAHLDGKFSLLEGVLGKHVVWDAHVSLRYWPRDHPEKEVNQSFDLKPVNIAQIQGLGLTFEPSRDGITEYNLFATSRSTTSMEQLEIRFNREAKEWQYQYWLWEPKPYKTIPVAPILLKRLNWTPIPYPRLQ